ncbi:ribosomal protein L1p/L10e family-domain-containing protein [Pisolithus orientalis]|uniref:ribosomal protein L1p/L10e family-domain-containing protein n=1 Tax=Pisolithus orientalis TaxID=936130 RepID=UPI0022254092|nr:ribosomal protein L1p/L10e family-domain-containing protein [Pisolithus orientalis]KAI6030828.1 ribosomal protein L1p/L10e family-domain-containing protein [Pisolithus orientalis]
MAKTELIDDHVSLKQCKRAVTALHDYATKKEKEREETELLPGKEQHVWLQITVKKMQPTQKVKPIRIPLKYTLVDPRTSAVCLITKDPQREYKDLLQQHDIKFISRVVGIEKLKGKFKAFEARRLLLKENALFLADDRVIPLLPRLLGSKWFDAKKQPIPVNLKRKDLKTELERAVESSYMHQNRGTCTSVKVGVLSQTPKQVLANIQAALPAITSHIKGGWDNIQCLHIKTNSSVSLPIWSCELSDEVGGRWAGLTMEESEEEDGSTDEGESEDEDEMSVDEAEIPSRSPTPPPPKKVRKKSAFSTAASAAEDRPPKKKGTQSTPSAITPATADQPPKKKEKPTKTSEDRKERSNKPSSPPPVATISHEEVKTKRSADTGEKKKEKVVKGRVSKSPKNALIGKKAGESSPAAPALADQPPKKKEKPAKTAGDATEQSNKPSTHSPVAAVGREEVKTTENADVVEKKEKVVKGRKSKEKPPKIAGDQTEQSNQTLITPSGSYHQSKGSEEQAKCGRRGKEKGKGCEG